MYKRQVLDDAGRPIAHSWLPAGTAPPAATRTWAIVPGNTVRVLWKRLPAHNPVQALAAARAMLADDLAEAPESLHIAIGPGDADALRPLAVVAPERMRGWLAQLEALGVRADGMIPDCLALPLPEGTRVVAEWQDEWLVRDAGLAFRAAPALARQLLGPDARPGLDPEAAHAAMVAGLTRPALNLLQYGFAPAELRATPSRGRLMAVLSLLLLASPLVLLLAEGLRYRHAATRLQAADQARIDRHLPGRPASLNAQAWLQQAADRQQRGAQLPSGLARLSAAIMASAATHLEVLHVDAAGMITATVLHPDDAGLAELLARLHAAGVAAESAGTRPDGAGLRSELVIQPEAAP